MLGFRPSSKPVVLFETHVQLGVVHRPCSKTLPEIECTKCRADSRAIVSSIAVLRIFEVCKIIPSKEMVIIVIQPWLKIFHASNFSQGVYHMVLEEPFRGTHIRNVIETKKSFPRSLKYLIWPSNVQRLGSVHPRLVLSPAYYARGIHT